MTTKSTSFRHDKITQPTVILVNLGTPDAPHEKALRRYLREFLSDTRVVEIPKWIWWFILNGIIIPFRAKKSAAKYASVWTNEGSPLKVHTLKQATLLQEALLLKGLNVNVVAAMRYGQPALPDVLAQIQAEAGQQVLILPAYPQYSGTTTASIFDAVADFYKKARNIPELRFIKHYHDHPGYIQALKASVLAAWNKNKRGEHLVISFHGIPKRSLLAGDPYYCECQKTARLLAESLGLNKDEYSVTFQSRFGKATWLQPYTLPTVKNLAEKGIQRLDVICPGFTSDCLETLEEINIELRDEYIREGGLVFNYIPCLNEDATWMQGLAEIVEAHLHAWPTKQDDVLHRQQQASLSQTLAKQLGAQQ